MLLSSPIGQCYCAFCKSPRKYFVDKSVRGIHWIQSTLVSVFLMYVIWGGWDPRVLVLWPTCLILTDILLHFRWRAYIVCPKCGFDPVLYVKDPKAAAQKVKEYMKKYENEIEYSLLPNPKRNLYHRRVPALPEKPESTVKG